MQQEEGWLFTHSISVRDQTGVLHIDIVLGTVHVDKHGQGTSMVVGTDLA
jgi:hypothetical protein